MTQVSHFMLTKTTRRNDNPFLQMNLKGKKVFTQMSQRGTENHSCDLIIYESVTRDLWGPRPH